jgi:predicted Rossmann-fold nucleotide-binding protein
VLFDSDYWRGLVDWIQRRLLAERMISLDDQQLLLVTDDPETAVSTVIDCYRRRRAGALTQTVAGRTKAPGGAPAAGP